MCRRTMSMVKSLPLIVMCGGLGASRNIYSREKFPKGILFGNFFVSSTLTTLLQIFSKVNRKPSISLGYLCQSQKIPKKYTF